MNNLFFIATIFGEFFLFIVEQLNLFFWMKKDMEIDRLERELEASRIKFGLLFKAVISCGDKTIKKVTKVLEEMQ